jgi:hypothetical protein
VPAGAAARAFVRLRQISWRSAGSRKIREEFDLTADSFHAPTSSLLWQWEGASLLLHVVRSLAVLPASPVRLFGGDRQSRAELRSIVRGGSFTPTSGPSTKARVRFLFVYLRHP